MDFFASSESSAEISKAVERCRRATEVHLRECFRANGYSCYEWSVNYVPVVVGGAAAKAFPSRTRVLRKQMEIDIAPVLDYEIFRSSSVSDQIIEYLNGLVQGIKETFPKVGIQEKAILMDIAELQMRLAASYR